MVGLVHLVNYQYFKAVPEYQRDKLNCFEILVNYKVNYCEVALNFERIPKSTLQESGFDEFGRLYSPQLIPRNQECCSTHSTSDDFAVPSACCDLHERL